MDPKKGIDLSEFFPTTAPCNIMRIWFAGSVNGTVVRAVPYVCPLSMN